MRFAFKTLDGYIFKQILDYFLLGIVVFSLIALFSDAFLDFLQDMQKFGISLSTALTLVGLQMPKAISLVLPASSFLAVLMVFNALNNQFEIIAIRMNGISLARLMMPAVILGLFSSIAAYWLGDFVVPYCNQQSDLLKQQALSRGTLPEGRNSFTFRQFDEFHSLRKLVYVGRYHGRDLRDTTIIDLTRPNALQVIQSQSGTWHPENWELGNANVYTVSKVDNLLAFNHMEKVLMENLLSPQPRNNDEEAANRNAPGSLTVRSGNQPFADLYQTIQKREALGLRVARSSYIKMWEKLTLPLSSLFIILSAVPLALSPPRQGSNRGFIFALGVLFLYYLVRSICVAMAQAGLLTFGGVLSTPDAMMLAAFLPLLLSAVLGSYLLIRKSRVL